MSPWQHNWTNISGLQKNVCLSTCPCQCKYGGLPHETSSPHTPGHIPGLVWLVSIYRGSCVARGQAIISLEIPFPLNALENVCVRLSRTEHGAWINTARSAKSKVSFVTHLGPLVWDQSSTQTSSRRKLQSLPLSPSGVNVPSLTCIGHTSMTTFIDFIHLFVCPPDIEHPAVQILGWTPGC